MIQQRKTKKGFEHDILDIANDFYEAYRRCREGKNPRTDEWGRYVTDVVSVPELVNGLFACELYLKSILPNGSWNKGSNGHNLKSLFLLLPEEKQREMRKAISDMYDWQFHTVDESFDIISNGFQFWRYIHESEHFGDLGLNGSLRVLPAFLETFRKFANKR